MTTTIDNNQRVFYVHGTGWNTQQYFCNIRDLQTVFAQFEANQPFKVFECWNQKLKAISRKELREMLDANQIDSSFIK